MTHSESMIDIVNELEHMEKEVCNLPLIVAEMFKDEINANEEQKLYNGIKRIVKKYSGEKKYLDVINEFTRVVSGGASLHEILTVSKDEALNPTLASKLTVDQDCNLH